MGVGLMKELDDATQRNLNQHAQLQQFEAQAFVTALRQEINRSHEEGHRFIRTDMNIEDASRLADFMQRAIILGA